jgi:DnaJ-class molecular chaperone
VHLPKTGPAVVKATVTLEEVFCGSEKTIPWERKLSCVACSG